MTSEPDHRPFVFTISIVTFNGLEWLPRCLASLRAQTEQAYELVVLDNGSTDGTAAWLRQQAAADSTLRLVESATNEGYASGHNRNLEDARGEFVCLLNQDVELDPAFLHEAAMAFTIDGTVGAVQGRVRGLGPGGDRRDVLDTTGLEMSRDRRVVSRHQGRREDTDDLVPGPVFGADGPVPVYRRRALTDARLPAVGGGWEVLDEDFFMYKEDVDLAWRLRLLGWTAWYQPTALAWHARGATGAGSGGLMGAARASRRHPRWVNVLSWRNHRLSQVKNEALRPFVRDLPWIARREAAFLAFMVLTDPARLAAIPGFVRRLPSAMRKRRYLDRRLGGVRADPRTWTRR